MYRGIVVVPVLGVHDDELQIQLLRCIPEKEEEEGERK
jgi:hypothetical protein